MDGLWPTAFGVASAALVAGASLRCARSTPTATWAESLALGTAAALAIVGIAASLLGVFGVFDPISMTLCAASFAVAVWPRGSAPQLAAKRPNAGRAAIAGLALVCVAIALRLPATDASLAGRDQGTYVLRSATLQRTGAHTFIDPVLRAAAGSSSPARADVLGLHPKRTEPWRAGVYEAAYRPGWYLADRDGGVVVPQFLHLHSSLLASYRLVAGDAAVTVGVVVNTTVVMLLLLAIARRCFADRWVSFVPAAVVAVAPLAIWVHRTPLSENPSSVFLWGAVLAALRTRDHEPHDLELAAVLLGAMAWTRGNAWLATPVILATLWLLPGHAPQRRRPVAILTAVALGAVFAHASSVYPYLVDEFAKQMWRGPMPSPTGAVAISLFGAVVWWLVDATSFHRRADRGATARLRRVLPIALGVGAAIAWVAYLWLTATSAPRPFARLEAVYPTFGPVLLGLGVVAVPPLALRARLTRARDVWLAAVAACLVVNLLLYAQRNLPSAGLYYYGRYVAPGILPAFALLAAATLAAMQTLTKAASRRIRAGWRRVLWQHGPAVGLAAALLCSVAYPLVATPVVRHQEFGGSGRVVAEVAARSGPDATIIAGGEGWHAGHTFNQVGGALQMAYGLNVVPYRSREAFYATAHALLTSTGPTRAAGPTFLLLAEATHHRGTQATHYRGAEPRAPPIAAFDDLLPPPFTAVSVTHLELFSDRLTPSVGAQPSRVTRDQLRMTLVQLGVAPQRAGEQRFSILPGGHLRALTADAAPAGPAICLDPETPTEIALPPSATGPGSVVFITAPGVDRRNRRIELTIDGERRYPEVHALARHSDTLGPLTVDGARHTVSMLGYAAAASGDAPCPHGGVVELRWLAPDTHALQHSAPEFVSFPPPASRGHRVRPHHWVAGRGLSRLRPMLDPLPEIEGLTVVLRPTSPINFAPAQLPTAPGRPLDLVVTLTTSETSEGARLLLLERGRQIGVIVPPRAGARVWRSEPLRFMPLATTARFTLRLDSPVPTDVVRVRDIGLFSRSDAADPAGGRVH